MQDTQKKKQNYTVAKLEAQVCVCVQLKWGDWRFSGAPDKEANTLFPSDVIPELSALPHPAFFCMFPRDDEQKSRTARDEGGNKTWLED